MAAPALTDLVFYTNRDLTATDWSTNFTALINYLTAGTYDVSFNSVTLAGAVTFATGTDLTTTGTITAGDFVGDGSALTGLDINNKNWLTNGQMMVDSIATDTALMVKDTYYERVDNWEGMATGTAVSAAKLTKITDSTIGTTGYALKFESVTLTGSGIIYIRQRIYKEDASKLIGKTISVQALVKQDTGGSVNYVFTIRKADAADDFTTTTQIGTSGNIAKTTGAGGQIKYEGLAMGTCGNGVELELKASPGAITTKNFEFTEIQLEISPTITDFEQINYNTEYLKCQPMTKKYSLPGVAVIPDDASTATFETATNGQFRSKSATLSAAGWMPVNLPDGAVISSYKVYWYRDDSSASGLSSLRRHTLSDGTSSVMASADSNASTGNHSVEDTSISNATIDNSLYSYSASAYVDPNNATTDVVFYGLTITYMLNKPLP